MPVFVLSGRNLNAFVSSGDKSHFASCTLIQSMLRVRLCSDIVLHCPSTFSPPLCWLSGVEGQNAKKSLAVGGYWECLERTKAEAGVLGERRAGSLRV